MNPASKNTALGGMMAALAVVIMCLGGLIPVATFVCPMLCMILQWIVARLCGRRIGWAWYGGVALLSMLMGPDKEAAAVFACLGYYPMIKPKLDRTKPALLWKLLLFNTVIGVMYLVLIRLLGMEQIVSEYEALGFWLTAVMLVLGNVTFCLLDRVFDQLARRRRK